LNRFESNAGKLEILEYREVSMGRQFISQRAGAFTQHVERIDRAILKKFQDRVKEKQFIVNVRENT